MIRDTIGENPAQKLEVQQNGFTIVVADEAHKRMLEEL